MKVCPNCGSNHLMYSESAADNDYCANCLQPLPLGFLWNGGNIDD